MQHKIFLSSGEQIACPHCQCKFELGKGITRQTIEKCKRDFERAIEERATELRKEAEQEAERNLACTNATQLDDLTEQLTRNQQAVAEIKTPVEQVPKGARAKTLADFAHEKKMLQQELSKNDANIKKLRSQEVVLRQIKKELEESHREVALEMRRKLDGCTGPEN